VAALGWAKRENEAGVQGVHAGVTGGSRDAIELVENECDITCRQLPWDHDPTRPEIGKLIKLGKAT
jgi:hypothetical protein